MRETMQIKAADDRQPDLDALAALLERPGEGGHARRRIEQEIRQIRAGAAGERDAAYQIEFISHNAGELLRRSRITGSAMPRTAG